MTPKEKAKELVEKHRKVFGRTNKREMIYEAKQCALITVDEIIDLNFNINCDASEKCVNPVIKFYEQVKQEIEKL